LFVLLVLGSAVGVIGQNTIAFGGLWFTCFPHAAASYALAVEDFNALGLFQQYNYSLSWVSYPLPCVNQVVDFSPAMTAINKMIGKFGPQYELPFAYGLTVGNMMAQYQIRASGSDLPLFSPGTVDGDMSSKSLFPTNFVADASGTTQGKFLAYLVNYYCWQRVGILYNAQFNSIVDAFVIQCRALNIGVISSQSYILATFVGAQLDVKAQLLTLKTAGVKVLLMAVHQTDGAVFTQLKEVGLEKYFTIIGINEWLRFPPLQTSPITGPIVNGAIGIMPQFSTTVAGPTAAWTNFSAHWIARYNADKSFMFNVSVPVNSGSAQIYDGVYQVAYALYNYVRYKTNCTDPTYEPVMCNEFRTLSRGKFLYKLALNTTFQGYSGFFEADSTQTYRVTNWNIVNLRYPVPNTVIGTVSHSHTSAPVLSLAASTRWSDGTYVTPPDRILPLAVSSYPSYLLPLVAALIGVVASVPLALWVVVWVRRADPVVKSSSLVFNAFVLFGAFASAITAILYVVEVKDSVCVLRLWFTPMFFLIFYSPLFAKVYRLSFVYNSKHARKLRRVKEEYLVRTVLTALFVPLVLIIIGTASSRPNSEQVLSNGALETRCSSASDIVVYTLLAYIGLLMLWGSFMTIKIRNVPTYFNELSQIVLAMSFLLFYGILIIPIQFALTSSPTALALLRGPGILFGVIVALSILYIPKIIHLLEKHSDQEAEQPIVSLPLNVAVSLERLQTICGSLGVPCDTPSVAARNISLWLAGRHHDSQQMSSIAAGNAPSSVASGSSKLSMSTPAGPSQLSGMVNTSTV